MQRSVKAIPLLHNFRNFHLRLCLFHHSAWKVNKSKSKVNSYNYVLCVKQWTTSQPLRVKHSYRHCSTTSDVKKNEHYCTAEEYIMFYKFPYIVHARVLNRLKLYQTATVIVAVPLATFAYYNNTIGLLVLQYCCGISIFACVMLYIMGQLFRSLIGIMYLNKEKTMLKVSHLTFWGRRNELIIPVSNVIPLLETSTQRADLFYKLQTYDADLTLYFSVKYGHIIEKDMFYHVFGSIENM